MNKSDIAVSIASGALTALIVDTFIVGDISLTEAKKWGSEQVEDFVKKTAKRQAKDGRDLRNTEAIPDQFIQFRDVLTFPNWDCQYISLWKKKSPKALILGSSIIFMILTFVGAGYVLLNHGLVNAGYAVIPMCFCFVFVAFYIVSLVARFFN